MQKSKVFDLRFGFLIKNCIYFTPGTSQNRGGAKFNNWGGLLTAGSGYFDVSVDQEMRRNVQEIRGGHFGGVRDYLGVFGRHFGRKIGVKSAEKTPTELVNETI